MEKVTLIKDFGMHPAGTELEANEVLVAHLTKGGYLEAPPVEEVTEEQEQTEEKPKRKRKQ